MTVLAPIKFRARATATRSSELGQLQQARRDNELLKRRVERARERAEEGLVLCYS